MPFKFLLFLFATSWGFLPAFAGAPFVTDDPEVLELGEGELTVFSNLNKSNIIDDQPYWNFLAAELDICLFEDIQLSLMVPYSWADTTIHSAKGLGDIELGFTYRFFNETTYLPDMGIEPMMSVPTGNANLELGNGRIATQIPIWFQKTWGSWTTYFGGGWVFNTEPGDLNYPFAGWTIQNEINEKWTIGGEIYTQGADTSAGSAWTALNLGGGYEFNERFEIIFSAGHSIIGQQVILGYLGLEWEFCD